MDTQVTGEFGAVVERTKAALSAEGFGVLCDIDVTQTFADKLDEEFRQYRILGACNPRLASEAFDEELELGALLPCNVIVYEKDDGRVVVRAVEPGQLVGLTENPHLDSIADDVTNRFENVVRSL